MYVKLCRDHCLYSCYAASLLEFFVRTAGGVSHESVGFMSFSVVGGMTRGDGMSELWDCKKDAGAGSIATSRGGNQSGLRNVVRRNGRQDALWDAYIRDLNPFWLVRDADQDSDNESPCKRARRGEGCFLSSFRCLSCGCIRRVYIRVSRDILGFLGWSFLKSWQCALCTQFKDLT